MTSFSQSPWPLRSLGAICAQKETIDPRRSPGLPFRYVDIGSVSNERFEIVDARLIVGHDAPSRARKRIRFGDVILATTRPYLQTIAQVPTELDQQVCSTGFCVLRPSDGVLSEWLFYSVLSGDFLDQIKPKMRGANYPAVTDRDVLASEIPLPSIADQQRVVGRIKACMERIDEIEVLRKAAVKEAHALLPASLAAVFRELEEQHRLARVGDVITESRYGTSQKCLAPDTATPVLRIPNVAQGEVNFEKLKYTELGAPELSRLAMQEGDVLVVRTNGSPDLVGRCAVFEGADQPFAYASYLIRLRPDRTKVNPRYLAFFLSSTLGRDAIEKIKRTSAGQYNINSENLRAIELPLPPLAEQQQIAQRLRDQQVVARTIADDQLSRADEASLLRNAVLRKAFAGEL